MNIGLSDLSRYEYSKGSCTYIGRIDIGRIYINRINNDIVASGLAKILSEYILGEISFDILNICGSELSWYEYSKWPWKKF